MLSNGDVQCLLNLVDPQHRVQGQIARRHVETRVQSLRVITRNELGGFVVLPWRRERLACCHLDCKLLDPFFGVDVG